MSYFNRVYVIGRFTKDPELKVMKDGSKFATFTLAINELIHGNREEKKAIFLECTMNGVNGENVAKYCKKGDEILVEGSLAQRSYQDKNGVNHVATGIRGYNCQFLTKKQKPDAVGASKDSKVNPEDEKESWVETDMPF